MPAQIETKEYFIPANVIEHNTQPEDTLEDKFRKLVLELINKEGETTSPLVMIQKSIFNKDRMGYNIVTQLTWTK